MNKIIITFLTLALFQPCYSQSSGSIDLNNQSWIHGSENCSENTDPAIQVVQFNDNTWILRQNKCANYEAPFMFLFIGDKKALLMDTGATEDENIFPLYKTVSNLIKKHNGTSKDIELVVAHTHNHSDHRAADSQFIGKPNTTVVGLEVVHLKEFFNISNWPEEIVDFDLGERLFKIIPIPGHQSSSIALYDTQTKMLLTGDTFYPGRLYIRDWNSFKQSIARLVAFTDSNDISYILGNHIEMTQSAGIDYPIETIYQPNEHKLPLSINVLKELSSSLINLGDVPTKEIHDSFIIYPLD